jgi:hypothetical protein
VVNHSIYETVKDKKAILERGWLLVLTNKNRNGILVVALSLEIKVYGCDYLVS